MQNLPELIRWRARVTPDLPAIWFEGRQMTFRELDRRSNRVANALIERGVLPGDRICILDQNHDEFFEVIFGIAKAGAVYVPVNWRLAPPEVLYVVNDAAAKILFAGSAFAACVEKIQSEFKTVHTVISFSSESATWESYKSLCEGRAETDPYREILDSDTTWQLYTSGTTGSPKGAELTTSNL